MKIWSGRNVLWLLSYNMTWSDFRIDEVWERDWREKGEGERKKKNKKRKKVGRGFSIPCVFFYGGGYNYPQQKKNRPKKIAYQEKLGYDYLIFSFIPQVVSQHVKFRNTLTISMILPWSYFTWEPIFFNWLHLKRQISYLTKSNTKIWSMTKYIYISLVPIHKNIMNAS